MVDLLRARNVAAQLAAMPKARALGALERRRNAVGPDRFALEMRTLKRAVRGVVPPARRPGDPGTVTDAAGILPRRVRPARPDDPAYLIVKQRSGRGA